VFSEETRGGLRRGTPAGIEAMSKKRRHDAQRSRRRLEEHLGSALKTLDLAGSPEAVDEFLRLEKSGWKGEAGTAFASLAGHDELLAAICANLAAQDRLQLLSLQADARVVAMKCNLRAGGVLFTFKIAFDEDLAQYSPGKQLDLENIRIFNEEDEENVMDSCALPSNATINRMLPDRLGIRAAAYTRAGLRGLPSAGVVASAAAGRDMRRGER
jgi:Acetyltransferase (GNAT) domain